MLTVDHFARIRQRRRDGLTIREIADELGHAHKTILKALDEPEPKPFQTPPRTAPVFGPFQTLVDQILAEDEQAPPKQRHTAMQIYRRLVQENYSGGYDQVRRYLQRRRREHRETFVPLDHPPGRRCEADFGHIHVDFPDGRKLVPVLMMTWSYSNAPFAIALPTERTEAVLHGMSEAFAFFGCVPQEVWWDNPTTVTIQVHRGRDRVLHPRYAALVSHFVFPPKFCLPATPQEKPRVENRVKDLERMFATPVPVVKDLAELNEQLRSWCRQATERTCSTNSETVGTRFEKDRAAASPVTPRPFEACVLQPGSVDKYQTVALDGNRYRVPRRYAFQSVTVKGFVDRVEIVAEHQVVATHVRRYGRHEQVLDPLHFLVILERKPATLDHAPVYRDWQLPPIFATLRAQLEADLGSPKGVRQYIGVLKLLAQFSVAVVEQAIAVQLVRGDPSATAIAATAERLAVSITRPPPSNAPPVSVPLPDLARFNRLLPHSGDDDARSDHDAPEGQPQAVEVADDVGRAREVGP